MSKDQPLIGKYFLGVHDELWMSGIVEAAVDDAHYLVRFDDLVRFTEGTYRGSSRKQVGTRCCGDQRHGQAWARVWR